MEKITRRFLLKSITAATLTAAASTVLAGCCIPPFSGKFCPQTQTLTVPDGTMTVSTTKFYKNAEGNLVLGLSIKNDMGMNISTNTAYLWKTSYFFDQDTSLTSAYRETARLAGNTPHWSVISFPADQKTETEFVLPDPSSLVNFVSDPLTRSRFENWSTFSFIFILENQSTGFPSVSEEIRFDLSRS